VIEKKVVVARPPRDDGFPKWAVIPLAVLGGLLLLVLYIAFARNSEDEIANLRVNVNTTRPASRTTDVSRSEPVSQPPVGSIDTTTSSVPESSQTLNVPGSQTGVSDVRDQKGTVVLDARVISKTGATQAVKNEKFYLLDKDIETILNDADVEPIEGRSMSESLGLSVLYPDRYAEFRTSALRAIKDHIKYAGTTDGSGKAQLGGVSPDSYYLFAITRAGKGFAVWNSPVTIIGGQNNLNLGPQQLNEIELTSGE
jgi:hypothetical protein